MQIDLSPFLDALLGPLGLTAFLLLAVWALVTEQVVPRSRLTEATGAAKDALAVAEGSNDAFDRLAEALEERNKLDQALLQSEGIEPPRARAMARRRAGS